MERSAPVLPLVGWADKAEPPTGHSARRPIEPVLVVPRGVGPRALVTLSASGMNPDGGVYEARMAARTSRSGVSRRPGRVSAARSDRSPGRVSYLPRLSQATLRLEQAAEDEAADVRQMGRGRCEPSWLRKPGSGSSKSGLHSLT
jgi:hypothetical protein